MKRVGLLATALTIGLHAAVLWRGWPLPARFLSLPDSVEYLSLAVNLRQGHGFSQAVRPPYEPDFLRTPVYPAVVAVLPAAAAPPAVAVDREPTQGTAGRERLIRQSALLNTAIGLLTIAAVTWVVRQRYGVTAATVTLVLLATDVLTLAFHALVLTETLFAALLCLAIGLLTAQRGPASRLAWPRVAAAGGCLGLAVLCRPIAIALAPALLPVFVVRHGPHSWKRIGTAYVVCNLVAAGMAGAWVVRNVAVFGEASLTSVGAVNLYLHRAAYVEAARSGEPVEAVRERLAAEFERQTRGLSEADRTRWLEREGQARIVADPLAYAGQHLRGVLRMLGPDHDGLPQVLSLSTASDGWRNGWMVRLVVLLGLLHLAVVYAGVVGAVWRCPRDPLVIAAVTVLIYIAVIGGPEMYARFRMPLMPLLAAAAGVFVSDGRLSRA